MAVSYVGASHSPGRDGENATSSTISKPSGVQQNDLLLAIVTISSSSGTVTPPSGWTAIRNSTSGSFFRVYIFRKVAGASEPSSYAFTFNGSYWGIEHIVAYRGVDTSDPTPESALRATSGGSTSYATGSLTTAGDRVLVHWATAYTGVAGSIRSWTASSGTERFDTGVVNNGDAGQAMSTGFYDSNSQLAAGNYSRTHTSSGSYDNGMAGIVAIKPLNNPSSGSFAVTAPAVTADINGTRMVPTGSFEAEVPAPSAEFTGEFLGDRLSAVSPTPTANIQARHIIDAELQAQAPTPTTDIEAGTEGFATLNATAPAAQLWIGTETKVVGSRVIVVVEEDRTTYV